MEQRNANMQHAPYGKMLCKRCRGKVLRRKTNFLLQNVFCQSRRLIFLKESPWNYTNSHKKCFQVSFLLVLSYHLQKRR